MINVSYRNLDFPGIYTFPTWHKPYICTSDGTKHESVCYRHVVLSTGNKIISKYSIHIYFIFQVLAQKVQCRGQQMCDIQKPFVSTQLSMPGYRAHYGAES